MLIFLTGGLKITAHSSVRIYECLGTTYIWTAFGNDLTTIKKRFCICVNNIHENRIILIQLGIIL